MAEKSKELKVPGYLEGARAYAERYGSLRDEARRYFWLAVALACLCALLGMSLVAIARQAEVVPYVVQVDAHGYAVPVGVVDEAAAVGDNVIVAAMRDFLVNWRAVVTDRMAQQRMVTKVLAMASPGSQVERDLFEWYQANNPMKFPEGARVDVQIGRVQKLSSRTYLVEWEETTRGTRESDGVKRWSAHIELTVASRGSMESIEKNPLGIYVKSLSVTRQ